MNTKRPTNPLTGEILETREQLTLSELCQACGVQVDWITELVDEGILEPIEANVEEWRFSSVSIVRVKKVYRLQQDLGVNIPGIALALDLMDEVEELRKQILRS